MGSAVLISVPSDTIEGTLTTGTIAVATGPHEIGNGHLIDSANFTSDSSGNMVFGGTGSFGGALNMNSNKIASLTNGSSAQDAAAFGQIASGVDAAVNGTSGQFSEFSATNAIINSPLDDGNTTTGWVTLRGKPLAIYSTAQSLYGAKIDVDGFSFIDEMDDGPIGQVLALGWTPGAVGQMKGNIDSRDMTNVHDDTIASAGGGYFEESSTFDATSNDKIAYGIHVVDDVARSAGAHNVLAYGVKVDMSSSPGAGVIQDAFEADYGDVYLGAGALTVAAGATTLHATTATTFHATSTGQFDSSLTSTGNLISTSGDIEAQGGNVKNAGDFEWTGTNAYLYPTTAVSGTTVKSVHIASSGTAGQIIFNDTGAGTNAGTGGLILKAGNNSNTTVWSVNGSGNELVTGTFNNSGGNSQLGDWTIQTAGGRVYAYIQSGGNESMEIDAAGTGAIDFNNTGGNAGVVGDVTFYNGSGGAKQLAISPHGAIKTFGTLPTLSAGCGTGATVAGGSYDGVLTLTGDAAVSCVVSFVANLTGTERCTITDRAGLVPAYTPAVGSLTLVPVASHVYDFNCGGH